MPSAKRRTESSHEAGERIDWLSPSGKIIGTVDKRFAHSHGLFHAVVHLLAIDAKNRLISQHRAKWMLLQPGKFDTTAGGHITSGETKEQSMVREAKEEMNVRGPFHYLGSIDVHDVQKTYDCHERAFFFWKKIKQPIRYQRSEIQGVQRIPIEKVAAFTRTSKSALMLCKGWAKFGKKIIRACSD